MLCKTYRTPRSMYTRYHIPSPYWMSYWNWYYPNAVNMIDSSVQNANQSVNNTGMINGLSQAINQLSLK